MSEETVEHLIKTLDLTPHPEGGYFKETYRSQDSIPAEALASHSGPRHVSTAIYYLLPAGKKSRWHRIKSDEMWHFYMGVPLRIMELSRDGLKETILGHDLSRGQKPQHLVCAGTWFGATPLPDEGYALVGCTVAPGFDFDDFEMASATELVDQWPEHIQTIKELL